MILTGATFLAAVMAVTTASNCSPGPVDVMFVLSSDSSLEKIMFDKQINVLKEFIQRVSIGPDDVLVGFITEEDFADLNFDMDDHTDKTELSIAILFTYFHDGTPNFGSGLEYIHEHGMDADLGGRVGVPDVVIFLTDGIPNDYSLAQKEAQKLTEAGVVVISVGVGDMDKSDLVKVASGCHYVLHASDFTTTNILSEAMVNLTCDAANGVPVDNCDIDCQLTADLVFLLDASDGQSEDDFKKQLTFAQDIVSGLKIANNESRVAAVTYSTNSHPQFELNSHLDMARLRLALSFLPFQRDDERNVEEGLSYITDNSFITSVASRGPVHKLVILTATGPLSNPSKAEAEAMKLKNSGVDIVSIGVGDFSPSELATLSTDDQSMQFKSFNDLIPMANSVVNFICKGFASGLTYAPTDTTAVATMTTVNSLPQCDFNPCFNGGTCYVIPGDEYVCHCPPGFTGSACFGVLASTTPPLTTTVATTTRGPQCDFNPCHNGGTCFTISGDQYVCVCPPGFTGPACFETVSTVSIQATTMEQCSFNPCHNGGTCEVVEGVYKCHCLVGFEGPACFDIRSVTTPPPKCPLNPCKNGGTCVPKSDQFSCICADGFSGATCSDVVHTQECTVNQCQNGGTCVAVGDIFNIRYTCSCANGFSGPTCSDVVPTAANEQTTAASGSQECTFNPCHNGGTCVTVGDVFNIRYECTCPDGFTGPTCFDMITTTTTAAPTTTMTIGPTQPCSYNACYNGGTCYAINGVYNCNCPAAFKGIACQERA